MVEVPNAPGVRPERHRLPVGDRGRPRVTETLDQVDRLHRRGRPAGCATDTGSCADPVVELAGFDGPAGQRRGVRPGHVDERIGGVSASASRWLSGTSAASPRTSASWMPRARYMPTATWSPDACAITMVRRLCATRLGEPAGQYRAAGEQPAQVPAGQRQPGMRGPPLDRGVRLTRTNGSASTTSSSASNRANRRRWTGWPAYRDPRPLPTRPANGPGLAHAHIGRDGRGRADLPRRDRPLPYTDRHHELSSVVVVEDSFHQYNEPKTSPVTPATPTG
jgi:hypothetical protein